MRSFIVFIFCILILGSTSCKSQQRISNINSTYINVKDFGAIGDGIADDTKSIQAAIKYAEGSGFSMPKIEGMYGINPVYIGASRIVFFPTGLYMISRALEIGSYGHLIGEKCLILPSKNNANKLIAFKAIGWQLRIEGIQFVKFNKCIAIDNNNVDVGKIIITDCDFHASNTAIELKAKSSISIIKENRFYDNKIAINIIKGDKVDVFDNWITSGTLSNTQESQIINNGILHFDRNLLVPKPPDKNAIEPAWINNYGSVTISGVRQGGEPGSFTLVNNFAEAVLGYPLIPNSVIIENSECYGAYYGNDIIPIAVLRLINIPNQISISNIRGMLDTKMLGMSIVTNKSKRSKILLPDNKSFITISINNCIGNRKLEENKTDVPDELLIFQK